ncbi:MAG TPA: Uma2 family endonuclease [Humisphaera sp.]
MTLTEPYIKRWTRAEFYQLGESGYFEGKRAFLLDGEIFEMPAQGNWHALAIELADNVVRPVLPQPIRFRIQSPLEGPNAGSDPEPDIAVVAGEATPDIASHPTTARLVIEVADSSLRLDRRKAAAYAAMGVAEYWIENLVDRQLEVHRDPQPDSSAEYGWRYAKAFTLKPGDRISPLVAPAASIEVARLFPARPPGDTF